MVLHRPVDLATFIRRNPPERVETLKRFLLLVTIYQVTSCLMPWHGNWPPPPMAFLKYFIPE
jgi:hypothetical protein